MIPWTPQMPLSCFDSRLRLSSQGWMRVGLASVLPQARSRPDVLTRRVPALLYLLPACRNQATRFHSPYRVLVDSCVVLAWPCDCSLGLLIRVLVSTSNGRADSSGPDVAERPPHASLCRFFLQSLCIYLDKPLRIAKLCTTVACVITGDLFSRFLNGFMRHHPLSSPASFPCGSLRRGS